MINKSERKTSNGLLNIFPKDDKKVLELYDFFYPRDIDEKVYDNRMNFWQNAIKAYCEDKGVATFSILELQQFFTHKGNKPKCLPAVIQFLVQTNQVIEMEAFELNPSNTWFGGSKLSLFKQLLFLGWNQLKRKLNFNQNEYMKVQYVHLTVLKSLNELLVSKVLENLRGQIKLYKDIKTLTEQALPQMTESCLKLSLYSLFHHGIIGISDPQTLNLQINHLIKIPKEDDTADFTASDIASSLCELENIKLSMQNLIRRFESNIENNESSMLYLVKDDDKDRAKQILKKQRNLEKKRTLLRLGFMNLGPTISSADMTDDSGLTGTADDCLMVEL